MAELWIANCTKQIKEVHYRLPESNRVFEFKVMPSAQAKVPHDMTTEQIEYFVKQHAPYGLRDEASVKSVREHVGLLYSIGKPVDMKRVTAIRGRNDEILTESVDETIKQMLLAADHQVRKESGDEVKVNSLEIDEVVPANEDRKPSSRKVKIAGRQVPGAA